MMLAQQLPAKAPVAAVLREAVLLADAVDMALSKPTQSRRVTHGC